MERQAIKFARHNLLNFAFLLAALLAAPTVQSQILISGDDKLIDYSVPKEYIIGGITVDGLRHLDKNAIILLSGMGVGDKVTIPGQKTADAVRNLWKQQLFSEIKIRATKIQGNTIFLTYSLTERPRLSFFKFEGISKGEVNDIREMIDYHTGKIVTENLTNTTRHKVRGFFIDKGFYKVGVDISQQKDTTINNGVILTINVAKGSRIKVKNIDFEGNENLSTAKLRRTMKNTKEKKWWRIFSPSKFLIGQYEDDKKALAGRYNVDGFRDANVAWDSVYTYDEKSLNINIKMEEGRKYYFRNISWVGNTLYSSDVLDRVLGIERGDVYNQATLDARLFYDPKGGQDITSLYMDDGYLFFSITPVEVLVEGDSIDLEMRINEGKQARVNRIIIKGNVKTNDHVILREIRVKPGDLFNRTDIMRTTRELAQLGYFDPEKLDVNPIPDPVNGTVDIEFQVEERSSDQIELSGGWGAGRIVGTLGLSLNNFSARNMFTGPWDPVPSGDGQRVSIRAQSNGSWFQSYNASFTEPWLGGKKPNALSVSVFHSIQTNGQPKNIEIEGEKVPNPDRNFIKITGASLGLGQRLRWPDDFFTVYNEISYQHYNLNNFGSVFAFSEGEANNLSYRFSLSRNSVDRPIFPMRGSNVTLTLKFTPPFSLFDDITDYRNVSDQDKYRWIEYHKWKFTSEWFTPLTNGKNKLVLRTKFGFGILGSYNQSLGAAPFERFYLGGSALTGFSLDGREIIALRGYDDLSVAPSTGSTIVNKYTAELRYPLSLNPNATIFALAFAEAGNTWTKVNDYNPFSVKRSAGVGVRIFLPMFGLMGLDYGLGFDPLETDPFFVPFKTSKQGQFHFTIGMNLGEL